MYYFIIDFYIILSDKFVNFGVFHGISLKLWEMGVDRISQLWIEIKRDAKKC